MRDVAMTSSVEKWKRLRHPGVVTLREAFTTQAFGDSSLVCVYDFWPNAETMKERWFQQSISNHSPNAAPPATASASAQNRFFLCCRWTKGEICHVRRNFVVVYNANCIGTEMNSLYWLGVPSIGAVKDFDYWEKSHYSSVVGRNKGSSPKPVRFQRVLVSYKKTVNIRF
jgi:hypothetical protein